MVYAQVNIKDAFAPAAKFGTIGDILNVIIPFITVLGGLIFAIMLFVGAFTIITAGADPEKFKKAQKTLKFAIVGFFIVLGAFLTVKLVQFLFGINVF